MGISMNTAPLYRALADDTRRKIISLLLEHSYCVSELARKLQVSESAVSQHLKVLKQADMLTGEKRGYYMHYDIDREKLHLLARDIEGLANTNRLPCKGVEGSCCHLSGDSCSAEVKFFCHGTQIMADKVQLPMAPSMPTKE